MEITNQQENLDLRRREWQRWTPFLGTYRMFRDSITGDDSRLYRIYGEEYNLKNFIYNIVNTAVFGGGSLSGLTYLLY